MSDKTPNGVVKKAGEIKDLYQRVHFDLRERAICRAAPGAVVTAETRAEWEQPGFIYQNATEEQQMQLASYAGYFLGRTLTSYLARPDYPLPLPIAMKLPRRWNCTSEISVRLDERNEKASSGGFLVQLAPPSPTSVSEREDIQYSLDGNSTFTAPFAHNDDIFVELPRPQKKPLNCTESLRSSDESLSDGEVLGDVDKHIW